MVINSSTTLPVKLNRVAAAFDEMMARLGSCESSGSEHSPDLSLLVNSFFERELISDHREINASDDQESADEIDGSRCKESADEINSSDHIELRNSLKKSLLVDGENEVDAAKRRSIRAEVAAAMEGVSGEKYEFKRRLTARLVARGIDAGLCKSRWEKSGRNQSGKYEYIDVNSGGDRYIVEVNLAEEFTIARPTATYADLLENFPQIFVGKPEDLKRVIGLMSKAMRKSLKSAALDVPPWRRLGYMQAKWLGFYRRTVNEARTERAAVSLAGNRMVGFAPAVMGTTPKTTSFYCREDFPAKIGGRIGGLAVALK